MRIGKSEEYSSHHMCSTPSQIYLFHYYWKICFRINICVWLKKTLSTEPQEKKKRKMLSRSLYGFGQMCILFLSKPPVYEYSAWKRFFITFENVFVFLNLYLNFQRTSTGAKVYKYPDRKVERDSSKFWFCGVQTGILNKTIQNVWRWCLCLSSWQWYDNKNMDYSIWITVIGRLK